MAKQTINIGVTANDGTGDTIREAFNKANQNFDELYASSGGAVGDLQQVTDNGGTTTNPIIVSDASITLDNTTDDTVIILEGSDGSIMVIDPVSDDNTALTKADIIVTGGDAQIRVNKDKISRVKGVFNTDVTFEEPTQVNEIIVPNEDGTIATREWVVANPSGGAVDSVNGQTGTVVLDADDISDSGTTNKFVTSAEKSTWDGKQDSLGFTPANVANTPRLLKSIFTGNAVTGTETVVGTCQVGGISLGSSFSLKCFLRSQKSNTTSQGNLKFYLNTTPDLSGSPVQIAVNASTSALVIPLERTFIYSGGNLYGYNSTNNAPTDVANATVAETVTAVDMSTTRYIVATLQTTGTAGSTLNGRDFKVIVEPNVV